MICAHRNTSARRDGAYLHVTYGRHHLPPPPAAVQPPPPAPLAFWFGRDAFWACASTHTAAHRWATAKQVVCAPLAVQLPLRSPSAPVCPQRAVPLEPLEPLEPLPAPSEAHAPAPTARGAAEALALPDALESLEPLEPLCAPAALCEAR